MPDKKLTDSEIVKALKEILEIMLTMGDLQKSATISNALDLINRLQVNNKELNEKLVVYKGAIDWQAKEINRLQAEVGRLQSILMSFMSEVETWSNKKGYDTTELSLIAILDEAKNVTLNIKAEAYKEFAERLKGKFAIAIIKNVSVEFALGYKTAFIDITDKIDNLLKEMIGE